MSRTGFADRPDDWQGNGSARKWLPLISVEGAFANVFIVITGGAFLTGLALMLGANDFEIGLLGAIPFVAQLAQLFSAYLSGRIGSRKTFSVWCAVFGRQIWWLVIPILFLVGDWRLEAFFTILILSNVAIMTSAPVWLSWMADIVPDRIRARYFGYRSAGIAFSTISATVLGGIILDKFRNGGQEATGFAVIICFACAFALAAVLLLRKLPDRQVAETNEDTIRWGNVLEPLKDRNFRSLLKVFFVWNVAVGISAIFFAAHMISNLKMSFTMISLYSSVPAIMAILLNKPWGVVIDRFGSRPVIVICALGIAMIPIIWWIPRPDFLWILGFEAVYSGVLWTGFNLAAFNIPIANSPKSKRTSYLAMFAVVTGIGFFAASVVGGYLAESFSFFHWKLGKQTIINYHLLFGVSAMMRFLSGLLFLSFHEPKEKAIPIMVQFMGYSMLKRLSVGRQIFPRGVKMIGEFVHQSRRDFHWK